MCLTCRFMVMKKSTKKYSSSIGQKTGTSKMGKNVASIPKRNDLDEEYLHAFELQINLLHSCLACALTLVILTSQTYASLMTLQGPKFD